MEPSPEKLALLAKFNTTTVVYQTIKDHDITVDIMTAKELKPGKHPLLIRFHGGGLVTGSSSFPAFIDPTLLTLTLQHSAIILSPNYRLLPECPPSAFLSDLSSFFTWLTSPASLSSYPASHTPDLHRILLTGDSAGGYFALQALLHPAILRLRTSDPPLLTIRTALLAFPMLDIRSPFFTQPSSASNPKLTLGIPLIQHSLITDHIAAMRPDAVVSAADPPERFDLMVAAIQWGVYGEWLGARSEMYPLEVLRGMGRVEIENRLPKRVVVFHGGADSLVPVEGSRRFLGLLEEKGVGRERVRFVVVEGKEHGVEIGDAGGVVDGGIEWVAEAWLSDGDAVL